MINLKLFSERLRELRIENQLTMEELAKAVGLKAKTSISLYEKGSNEPSGSTLLALANYFGVSPEYLTGESDQPDNILKTAEETAIPPAQYVEKYNKAAAGNRLKLLRKKRRLSQEQLAAQVGISARILRNMERGARPIDLDSIITLANFYNTSTDYILGGTDSPLPDLEDAAGYAVKEPSGNVYEGSEPGHSLEALIQELDEESLQELLNYLKLLKIKQDFNAGSA